MWISPCLWNWARCAIVCEFHHVVQLFVNFTMLCNWLWILPCCAIVCEFHHVVQLIVNFTNCLFVIVCEVVALFGCCWGVVKVLLRCCWDVAEVILGYCCGSPLCYELRSTFYKWLLTYRTISRVATATKKPIYFAMHFSGTMKIISL